MSTRGEWAALVIAMQQCRIKGHVPSKVDRFCGRCGTRLPVPDEVDEAPTYEPPHYDGRGVVRRRVQPVSAPHMELTAGWWLCPRCKYSALADPQRPAPVCPECSADEVNGGQS